LLSSLQDVNANKNKEKYDFMAVYLCLVIKYKPLKILLKIKIDPNPLTVLATVNEFKSSTKNPSYLIFSDFP
jgi:hypothetical protein